MVHFRTWLIAFFVFLFFLHCFYFIKSQFFQSRLKLKTEKQRFPASDINRLRGTPLRFFFNFQDFFQSLACILCYLLLSILHLTSVAEVFSNCISADSQIVSIFTRSTLPLRFLASLILPTPKKAPCGLKLCFAFGAFPPLTFWISLGRN